MSVVDHRLPLGAEGKKHAPGERVQQKPGEKNQTVHGRPQGKDRDQRYNPQGKSRGGLEQLGRNPLGPNPTVG